MHRDCAPFKERCGETRSAVQIQREGHPGRRGVARDNSLWVVRQPLEMESPPDTEQAGAARGLNGFVSSMRGKLS